MKRIFCITKPEDFCPKIEVVSIFYQFGDKILLLERNPNKPFGGTWCLPGGKLGKDEDVREGLIREFAEETTIELHKDNVAWIKTFYVRAPEMDYIFHVCRSYITDFPGPIILRPQEHQNLQWITIDDALQLDLIPGEAECIRLVYEK